MSVSHKRFAPSNMFRILGCPGHLLAVEALPPTSRDSGDSIYSRRGTCAHAVSEMILNTYKETDVLADPDDFLDQEIEKVIVDEEIVAIVREYVDYCVKRADEDFADDFEAEVNLDLSTWAPTLDLGIRGEDIGGTMDFILLYFMIRLLEIADLKSGSGKVIEVGDNPQLLTYALCVLEKYGFDKFDNIRITVAQPPADHKDGPIRSKDYTPAEIWEWGEKVMLPGIKLALQPDAPFYPSDKNCTFCPMSGRCPAQYEHSLDVALVDFEDLLDAPAIIEYEPKPKAYFPSIDQLTPEQEYLILSEGSLIVDFVNKVREKAKEKALQGDMPQHYKLVAKRANRKYKDDADEKRMHKALTRLGLRPHDYTEMPKMKSPSQIETSLKARGAKPEVIKVFMDKFVYKPDNGYNLVHESAKGKALPPPVEADFADLFEEDDLL